MKLKMLFFGFLIASVTLPIQTMDEQNEISHTPTKIYFDADGNQIECWMETKYEEHQHKIIVPSSDETSYELIYLHGNSINQIIIPENANAIQLVRLATQKKLNKHERVIKNMQREKKREQDEKQKREEEALKKSFKFQKKRSGLKKVIKTLPKKKAIFSKKR